MTAPTGPVSVEIPIDIQQSVIDMPADWSPLPVAVLAPSEAALDALKRLASTSATSSVGPTAVGSIKEIDSTDTLKAIAAAYLSAFTQNAKTYPYLVG